MVDKIDHIGIAVNSIQERIGFWTQVVGLEDVGTEVVPEQKVRVAMIKVGQSKIELLEPTSEDSPVAKFIASRGEGVHHIAVRVDDIEQAIAKAQDAGCRMIDDKPRLGAGGAKIAFVHPRSAGSVLVEFCQRD